ncbi:hypothetical protein BDN72DRAFT_838557 [Pluteus cervinus]|uniref:Uncharacterized protein n=1 Tax=Pluteus cervinus TaxID=181527 RepID=A0ACD3B0H4_9AGAR|nr:hypothetical protein BDN72DRAFT_838557 [Pluteus cervinus]
MAGGKHAGTCLVAFLASGLGTLLVSTVKGICISAIETTISWADTKRGAGSPTMAANHIVPNLGTAAPPSRSIHQA